MTVEESFDGNESLSNSMVFHTEDGAIGRYNKEDGTIEPKTATDDAAASDGLRRRRGNEEEEAVDKDVEKQGVAEDTAEGKKEQPFAASDTNGDDDGIGPNSARNDAVEKVERGLGGDSYSLFFIYSTPYKSTFIFAMAVFAFQVAVFSAFLSDIIDINSNNPLRIPPGCSTTVRVMQTFALLIALLNNGEIVGTISQWNDGYNNMKFSNLPKTASRSKWLLMGITHFAEGLLALTVNFILIIQSTQAKPLFLSLSATAIISKVDDLSFAVASLGYVTRSLQTKTEQVGKVKVTSTKVKNNSRMIFCLVYLALLAGWAVVVAQQRKGRYIADTVSLKFGTYNFLGYNFEYFSGPYDFDPDSLSGNKRAVYVERRFNEDSSLGRGQISYCEEEEAWIFSVVPVPATNGTAHLLPRSGKNCDWLLKSKKTESYAVTDFPTASSWSLWIGRSEPISYFRLGNADCFDRSDCFGRGECGDNRACICDKGWLGLNCQYEEPCQSISSLSGDVTVYDSTVSFAATFTQKSEYFPDGAMMYGLPIYHYVYPSDAFTSDARKIDFVYFTGRRWFLAQRWLLLEELENMDDVGAALKTYHAQWQKYFTPLLVSETTTSGSPTGLKWFRYSPDGEELPINSDGNGGLIFTCSQCKKASAISLDTCMNGECLTTSEEGNQVDRCKCAEGFHGTSCSLPPPTGTKNVVLYASLDFDHGGPSCRRCWYVPTIYEGDCFPLPVTDPLALGGGKVRMAASYDGEKVNVYSMTDDVLLQSIDTRDGLFQTTEATSKSDYFFYQRELCDENIATLVTTIQVDHNQTETGNFEEVLLEIDETATVSVLANDSFDRGNDPMFLNVNIDGTTEALCANVTEYTVGLCYTPSRISSLQTSKAWLALTVVPSETQ